MENKLAILIEIFYHYNEALCNLVLNSISLTEWEENYKNFVDFLTSLKTSNQAVLAEDESVIRNYDLFSAEDEEWLQVILYFALNRHSTFRWNYLYFREVIMPFKKEFLSNFLHSPDKDPLVISSLRSILLNFYADFNHFFKIDLGFYLNNPPCISDPKEEVKEFFEYLGTQYTIQLTFEKFKENYPQLEITASCEGIFNYVAHHYKHLNFPEEIWGLTTWDGEILIKEEFNSTKSIYFAATVINLIRETGNICWRIGKKSSIFQRCYHRNRKWFWEDFIWQ